MTALLREVTYLVYLLLTLVIIGIINNYFTYRLLREPFKLDKRIKSDSHEILNMNGDLIGVRASNHPDISLALSTPGLQVKYPTGKLDPGIQ